MSDILERRPRPGAAMDAEAVRAAYRRWAGIYDAVFGGVCCWRGGAPWPWSTTSPAATCWRSVSAPALPCPTTPPTGGSPASTYPRRCWRRPASAWPIARSPTSWRCARWTPRRPISPTPRSTSPWRCSSPRSCRIPGAAGGDAAGGAARRQHPVRQPFRRRERAAVVDRARFGASVARPRLASGLRRGGAVLARGPGTHHRRTPVPPFGIFKLVAAGGRLTLSRRNGRSR